MTVRRALELSLNAATVRVAEKVGLPAVIETARELGLESPLAEVPAIVLGAFETTPLELARAYLPLANGGLRPTDVLAVHAVHDRDGPIESRGHRTARAALTPAEAYLMTSLLEGVIQSGTAAAVRGARRHRARSPARPGRRTTAATRGSWVTPLACSPSCGSGSTAATPTG